MELVIESTKEFEKELEAFGETAKSLIIDQMNQCFQQIKKRSI